MQRRYTGTVRGERTRYTPRDVSLDSIHCVAHNMGVMVRFTQSARKHRIGRAHAST